MKLKEIMKTIKTKIVSFGALIPPKASFTHSGAVEEQPDSFSVN